MPEFMLLLHESPAESASLSPDDMQRIIERYRLWSGQLASSGQLLGGDKLREDGGKHLRRPRGGKRATSVDGPYAEAKEVVGGYFKISAADYDEAVRLATDCPHMDYGWIEVREIEPT
jgi:hypothetical protein